MRITVDLLKKIEYINSVSSYDDIDKQGYIIAEVMQWSYDKVNNLNARQFTKIINEINKSILKVKPFWKRCLPIIADANKLNFGQFVDLQHFYKQPEYLNYESIFARLISTDLQGFDKLQSKILKTDVRLILSKYLQFKESYQKLMQSNSDLFGLNNDNENEQENEATHPFINSFGWVFSAESIAEYYRIETQKVYELNILEALSALNYLKAKGEYIKTQT